MTDIEQIVAIFEAYPRHIAKGAALKAIHKAVLRLVKEKAQPDEHAARRWLWKKAAEYSRSPAGQKPAKGGNDYRPHPATFFNQDRYLDDPSEWQKPNGAPSNGNSNHYQTKADRTASAVRNLLHGRSETNHDGLGGGSDLQGRRSGRELFGPDDEKVIEGTH